MKRVLSLLTKLTFFLPYSHGPIMHFYLYCIHRKMFKKTIRAVAAANRLRSMTRTNTEMTDSSFASSLTEDEIQQQQQARQAEADVPVAADKS